MLSWILNDSRWTPNNNIATLGSGEMNYLPLNIPLHLFIDSALNDATGSGPYTIRMQDVTIASPSPNQIDSADFFARQHYLDFLNRQADAPGLAFWTNEITLCGSNQACIDAKRVNLSSLFPLNRISGNRFSGLQDLQSVVWEFAECSGAAQAQ